MIPSHTFLFPIFVKGLFFEWSRNKETIVNVYRRKLSNDFHILKRWCRHRAFSNIPNGRNVYAFSASYFFIFPLFLLLPFPSNSPPQNSAVSGYTVRIPSLRFPLKSFFALFLAFPFRDKFKNGLTQPGFPVFETKRRKTAVQKLRLFQVESKN